jgi:hypothetical protein
MSRIPQELVPANATVAAAATVAAGSSGVQSLWSITSAGGTGKCAGAEDDLPVTG